MAWRYETSVDWPVERAWNLMLTVVEDMLNLGHSCLGIPKRTVLFCFYIQKQILMFPFRCLNKMYEVILKPPLDYLFVAYRKLTAREITPLEALTGEPNPSAERIIEAAREIRSTAIKTINKRNSSIPSFQLYRKQLENWRLENEKKVEEIYKIDTEEKELMKAVASALRYLKQLKNKRDKMHTNFNESISSMINSGTVSAEKVRTAKKKIDLIDAAITEKKNICLNLLSRGQMTDNDMLGLFSPNLSAKSTPIRKETQSSTQEVEMIQKALNLMSEENTFLRGKISSTHDKIEEILKLSETINEEIVVLSRKFAKMAISGKEMASLQIKLDEEQELLKNVEADRDTMRDKLQVLEYMIKEEEEFLGDVAFDSACEDPDFSFTEDAIEDEVTF